MAKPNSIENKYYVEIDKDILESTGEVKIIGSPINVAEQLQRVPRGGFEIAYMSALFDIFDKLGNQKIKVLKYILKNKDGMNCLNMTNTAIAEAIPCARKTVVETMNILKDAGVITRKGTVLRISPRVVVKGSQQKEGYIMRKLVEENEGFKVINGNVAIEAVGE